MILDLSYKTRREREKKGEGDKWDGETKKVIFMFSLPSDNQSMCTWT